MFTFEKKRNWLSVIGTLSQGLANAITSHAIHFWGEISTTRNCVARSTASWTSERTSKLRRSICDKPSVGLAVLLDSVHCSLFCSWSNLASCDRVTPLLKYYLHELTIIVFASRSVNSTSNALSVGEFCSFRLAVGMTSVNVIEEWSESD